MARSLSPDNIRETRDPSPFETLCINYIKARFSLVPFSRFIAKAKIMKGGIRLSSIFN